MTKSKATKQFKKEPSTQKKINTQPNSKPTVRKSIATVEIDLRKPETHRIQIKIKHDKKRWPGLIQFPVWSPGSYMVREYSQHVSHMKGASKINKNTWRPYREANQISFEVYGFDRIVQTNYIDNKIAILVGSALLPLLHGPFEIILQLPKSWSVLGSALNFKATGSNSYKAKVRDDDHWIDCPIVTAKKNHGGTKKFLVGKIPHTFTWVGSEPSVPIDKIIADTKKICQRTIKMFGSAPFKQYNYLIDFAPGFYGGLEHRNSQLSQFDPDVLGDSTNYEAFMGLLAHEYFHAWNVKAIRPERLGPFNYLEENYTEDLWFAEGITSYFDEMIPLDCGISTQESVNKARLKDVNILKDGNPGHLRRSVAESSFDAWICLYHRNEDWLNRDVSYYVKGAQIAWCWDARLQKLTKKKWSLEKLMKEIYREYGITAEEPLATAAPGFTRKDLLLFCEKTTGQRHNFVEEWVNSTKPLPWREAAKFFNLHWEEKVHDIFHHQFGFGLNEEKGKLRATIVFNGTTAEKAGLAPKDEVIAVDDIRVTNKAQAEAAVKRSQTKVRWLVARAGRVFELTLKSKKHAGLGVEQIPANTKSAL